MSAEVTIMAAELRMVELCSPSDRHIASVKSEDGRTPTTDKGIFVEFHDYFHKLFSAESTV